MNNSTLKPNFTIKTFGMCLSQVVSIPKGTFWAEATSNSEKIKLVVIELAEGIRQSVRQWKILLNQKF